KVASDDTPEDTIKKRKTAVEIEMPPTPEENAKKLQSTENIFLETNGTVVPPPETRISDSDR
ncbi:hypothetical protein HK100_009835, partial [Physocladia obscura]